MKTTNADLDYDRPYNLVEPESELEIKVLRNLVRSELPTKWSGHTGDDQLFGVYINGDHEGGRFGLEVRPQSDDPMKMEDTVYRGTAYLLEAPNGSTKVAWTLDVDGEQQSNILPSEPVL